MDKFLLEGCLQLSRCIEYAFSNRSLLLNWLAINVNIKMCNFTRSIHPSNGRIHP